MSSARRLDALHVVAIILVMLQLGPALAHLFELPNKIGLARDAYLTVQQIYRGWALLGIVVIAALAVTLALTIAARRSPGRFGWSLAALIMLAAAHGLFWAFTQPANVATNYWSLLPEGWETLRARWEYSHAAAAVLTLGAAVSLVIGLAARPRPA